MKRLLLVVAACAHASPRPAAPLHPWFRSSSGGPIEVLGAVAQPGAVPYTPGITFGCALRLVGGPTAFARKTARITRTEGEHTFAFRIPIADVIDGRAPDPELAPGDVVLVDGIDE